MNILDRQRLDVVNQTQSNVVGWQGQFTQDSKPIEFERFRNCGEFATIGDCAATPISGFNPVEFDGI